jgi:integrase
MSVEKATRKGRDVWRVRWRDSAGQPHSKVLGRKQDAIAFDAEVKRSKRLGTLARMDGGRETLAEYAEEWARIHAVPLARKTRELYAGLLETHILPGLGGYPLCELTSETIARWQADRLGAGAPVESTRKALTLLGGILQRATEAGRIPTNPQRLVRKAAPPASEEVRPLAPIVVERICGFLRPRDRVFVRFLAYAGLRPQEARTLRWGHVGERTLTVHAPKTRRHSTQPRSVRLLAPLAQDLREWRMAAGRPGPDDPVLPAHDGGEWTEVGYEQWITRVWAPALKAAGLGYRRPYDLRHGFASLLAHEGRSAVYIAKQLGHRPALSLRTYQHILDELEDAPRISAEDAIRAARAEAASEKCPRITTGDAGTGPKTVP